MALKIRPLKENPATAPVSFRAALVFWLKLGFISFGGPAGQIAILHEELVEKRKWISEQRFLHALNYCMLLPGPEAQQLATYLGWLMHRSIGGIAAGILFLLPGMLLLIGLGWAYCTYAELPMVSAALRGIKPVIVAIVLFAAYRIGSKILKDRLLWSLCVLSLLASALLHAPFPLIILCAGLLGFLWEKTRNQSPTSKDDQKKGPEKSEEAFFDDTAPAPSHTQFRLHRLLTVIGTVLALWLAAMGLLIQVSGSDGLLPQMGWFFTKAAFLTFGGAYAVLPYVFEASVEHYHWLSPQQMMDGLALGETTPGPLIMIVTFVGYLAGAKAEIFGAAQPFWSGFLAALVATFFTFLPSFLFILAGAPLVEATHQNVRLKAPLNAISAAVVGVILNLAWFLGYHSFLPSGIQGPIDIEGLGIFALSLLALFRFKVTIAPMILIAGAIGTLQVWL